MSDTTYDFGPHREHVEAFSGQYLVMARYPNKTPHLVAYGLNAGHWLVTVEYDERGATLRTITR